MNVGTPVVFFWNNSVEIAGIVTASRVDAVSGNTYYTIALFDTANVGPGLSYPSARQTTDRAVGTCQPTCTAATIA